MKKLCTLIFFAFVFVACQKEYDPGPIPGQTGSDSTSTNPVDTNQTQADLQGTWNFISMTGQSQSTVDLTFDGEDERTISFLDFTTSDNKGTITFTDSTAASNDLSYSLTGSLKSYFYTDALLTDSLQNPLSESIPASSAIGSYKLIGNDSIYISNGFVSIPGGDGSTSAPAAGSKYVINGNILTLTQSLDTTYSQLVTGVTSNVRQQATAVMTFKKQ